MRSARCKYCKMEDHYIDDCPDILCKRCNDRGHPHWKCTGKKKSAPSRSSVTVQVVEEKVEEKPVKKVIRSQNPFDLLEEEDLMHDSDSIFHFLQYKDKPWEEL